MVRVAEYDDLELLWHTLGPEHHRYFRHRFRRQQAGRGEILLAHHDGRPVGAVFVSWDDADEREIQELLGGVPVIFHLYVARDHRGRGIGRELLRAAEDRLRRRGHDRVLLGVDRSNAAARGLYLRLGYAHPPEPELSNLGAGEQAYDILVADLHRDPPRWE